jgi:hypothetical protein
MFKNSMSVYLSHSPFVSFAEPEDCGPGFWQYIDVLGKKIDLEGWTRYRGDMRPPGCCWFDEWRDIEGTKKWRK